MNTYRPCVLAVFTNPAGEVLVAERSDYRGQWQFPQGGIDPGETAEQAIVREVWEELGTQNFKILACSPEPIQYDFPQESSAPISKNWRGQSQIWFCLRFDVGAAPDLSKATDREFVATRWTSAQEALDGVVEFKRTAYRKGLLSLGFKVS